MENLKKFSLLFAALAVAVCSFATIAGCDDDSDMENAVEDAGDATENAADDATDAMNDAVD